MAQRAAPSATAPRRSASIAILGSYTTNQLATMLWLAARCIGIGLEVYESPYAQYRQEIIDPESAAYAFEPELVVLAVHHGELTLPGFSPSPAEDVAAEVERWQSLWRTFGTHSSATLVQHLFALPPETPFRTPGLHAAWNPCGDGACGERRAGGVCAAADRDRGL